jgi:hypothetical protein
MKEQSEPPSFRLQNLSPEAKTERSFKDATITPRMGGAISPVKCERYMESRNVNPAKINVTPHSRRSSLPE